MVTDPDGSIEGWVPTPDGAIVVNEPQGSPAWYPVNDNPRDKAAYEFEITVPAGITALANGVLRSSVTSGDRTTWRWRETSPMAPYLATATSGRFDLDIQTGPNGLRIYNAVDSGLNPKRKAIAKGLLSMAPEILSFFSDLYGPYPFKAAGGIIDPAPDVDYSLEVQTKPVYAYVPDELTVVHELSHMWFGDAVTVKEWPDLWLHEASPRSPSGSGRSATAARAPSRRSMSATRTSSSRGARRRTRSSAPRSCSRRRSTTGAA